MKRAERTAEEDTVATRAAWEGVGYARCELDQAEREAAELRERRRQLMHEIDVVRAENQVLEKELNEQLGAWRMLDETQLKVVEILPRLRQVTDSWSYRLTLGLLAMLNRLRGLVLPKRH